MICKWIKKWWNKEKIEPYTGSTIHTVKLGFSTQELVIINEINLLRDRFNLPKLKPDLFVSAIAKSHSLYMSENQHVSHDNFPERQWNLKIHVLKPRWVGECVGGGLTSKGYVLNWYKSLKHMKIMLNKDANLIGISIEYDINNKSYATLLLTD